MSDQDAIREVHHPTSVDKVKAARRRLAFEELFVLQLHLLCARRDLLAKQPATPCNRTELVDALLSLMALENFTLTTGQQTALSDVLGDMASSTPMLRLLMGDVGCGKTIVALLALMAAHEADRQAVIMVPSTILADQHMETLTKLVRKLPGAQRPVVQLLSTQLSSEERTAALDGIKTGKISIVVGTQSVIQESVSFPRLGLVIVDEEHRFGVRQREALRNLNASGNTVPHVLTMSATPIPRSLALTAYGDFALSVIDEKPPGRGAPVRTEALAYGPGVRDSAWLRVREEVQAGGRVFIVYPLLHTAESKAEGDTKGPVLGAMEAYDQLKEGPLAGISMGLVHGSMVAKEKNASISDLAVGHTSVLVCTKVIEVGVNVDAATVSAIAKRPSTAFSLVYPAASRGGACRPFRAC
jgi:ATP-dependent DNA helicase RecG